MISKKRKIIVNSVVAFFFFVGVIWAAIIVAKPGQMSAREDQWSRIQKEKTITIGLDDTFVPMGFRDKQGKLVGFDIDLAEKVFANLGIKVKWQTIDWSMKETELNTGNIDALWNGYTKTPERAKQVAFSKSYHESNLTLVVNKTSGIHRFSDMTGKTLGIQTGSSAETDLNTHPEILKNYLAGQQAVGYDTFDKAFTDLNAKRLDGLLVDEDYARYYIEHQANPENYALLRGGFKPSEDVVGLRKGDKGLQQAINRELDRLQKNGFIRNLEARWFGPQPDLKKN
ncbi:amino acid ABC transporter substrate-binding protein [Fructobacillus sp. M2-14]|uniref:Amino acid ABC transporter substrate-binding protein n=1 Tax=Fructobacillus broussonetiae TaxID=2713173 RepID=A0ABS5QYQ6_9LACO|nr:amino acid ABC transporter substrate-binding protein [Fructobacillus broussonetiae]